MLAMGFWEVVVSIALITVSLLLIGLVLLQKNRGAGLSGAFGGVGGHSAFGTKTGDFLTWTTVGLVTVFLLLNIAGNHVFGPESLSTQQPAATTTPPAGSNQQGAGAAQQQQQKQQSSPAPQPVRPASPTGKTTPKPAGPSS